MIQWKINGICLSSTLACSMVYVPEGCFDGYVTSGYYTCGYVKAPTIYDNYAAVGYVTGGYVV